MTGYALKVGEVGSRTFRRLKVPLVLECFRVRFVIEAVEVRFAVNFLADADNPSQIPAAMFLRVNRRFFE